MEFSYVAYTENKKLVKGKISAANNDMAMSLLGYGGYEVVKLKPVNALFGGSSFASLFSKVKPQEIIMFSRQLALLLESGTDIVTAIELLKNQTTNRLLNKALDDVVSDIRGGSSLSNALMKHPKIFSKVYCQAVAAGEQGGSLEIVLRQMSEYIERAAIAEKKIKSALTYPVIVIVVAFIVLTLMITFVLPNFMQLYDAFGANPPTMTRIIMNIGNWAVKYGLFVLAGLFVIGIVVYAWSRTPAGKVQVDAIMLKLPVLGRIILLQELARISRTISLLFKVGVPIPEIMNMVVQGTSNRIVKSNLEEVREELIRGEGLFKPMQKRPIFLPLMVQMVGVGEETGNLDNTLTTVARSYEEDADEKTSAAIALIQPIITVVIGLVVALMALSMFSAMYGIYGQGIGE
jgi:type IV pilus assembly protein PilC